MSSEISHEDVRSLSRSHSTSSTRFGRKSLNMFFSRNVAHPRQLRFINGVAGAQICAVKEDQYILPREQYEQFKEQKLQEQHYNNYPVNKRLVSASTSVLVDPPLPYRPTYDQNLINSYASKLMPKRKKERLLPPISFWSTYGVVSDDTNRWREELGNLASSVGLMTSDELKKATERLQSEKNGLPSSPKRRPSYLTEANRPLTTSEYSRETGRLNENPKPRTSKSRGGTGIKMPSFVYCIDNGEREMWMVQVLCQILQTESMQDVQSWLVSAGPSEKEAARELIQKALQGLQESGRIELEQSNAAINHNKEVQVDLDQIQETLQRITETQQQNRTLLADPSLNPIYENEEAAPKSNNTIQNSTERARATSFTPLERLLTASQSYDNLNTKKQQQASQIPPKTAAVINDTKYALLPDKNENETRPYTADLFKIKSDVKSDKKLSAKIIKELVNFVEVDRQTKVGKTPTPATTTEKTLLFGTPNSQAKSSSTKTKLTKNAEKDSQVLTIED